MPRGWGGFAPYVPVQERLSRARRQVATLMKKAGREAEPVAVAGRHIAETFWGRAWCENLEHYSDFASRLPRGRTYLRNGSVMDLLVREGEVIALVAGSELYTVTIRMGALAPARWAAVRRECSGRIGSLIGLLRGELTDDVISILVAPEKGLFPAPREIDLGCTCPDSATMCKHVAATLYAVGARLDARPELFFTLRRVDQAELIAAAADAPSRAVASGRKTIPRAKIGALFGIDVDAEPVSESASPSTAPAAGPGRSRAPARASGRSAGRAPRR